MILQRSLLIAGIILGIVTCSGGPSTRISSETAVPMDDPTPEPQRDHGSPGAVVKEYLSACEMGDPTTAQALLIEGTRETDGAFESALCGLPEEASRSMWHEERVQGNTAYVTWEWEWAEQTRIERREFILARESGQWRIVSEEVTHTEEVRRTEAIEPIPAPLETRKEPNLGVGIAYLEQRGAEGSRTITTETRLINGTVIEEWVAGDEVTQAPTPTIIVEGARERVEVLSEAQQVVEAYFAVYAQADYAGVVEMSVAISVEERDVTAIYEETAFEIVTADVEATQLLEPYVQEQERTAAAPAGFLQERVADYPGLVYTVPVGMRAEVPVLIGYRAFGVELVAEETVQALYTQEEGWKVEYWGFLAAAAPDAVLAGSTVDGRVAEVRVEGVALMREATLIVLAPLEPDAATLREAGSMNELFAAASDDVGSEAGYLNGATIAEETDLGYVWWEPLHPQARNVTVEVGYGWPPNGWHDALTVPLVR